MEDFENYQIANAQKLKRLINQSIMLDYSLIPDVHNYQKDIILKRLRGFGGIVHYFTKAHRLMDIAKTEILRLEQEGKDMANGTIFFAEELTAAKGRLKRDWWSPRGGVYTCIVIYPQCVRELWGIYSILCGVSVCEILREWGVNAKIRWINDILINGKKVCGILTETFISPLHQENYILLGMGLNVNIPKFPHYLPHATSLLLETGHNFPELSLSAHIFSRMGFNLALFHHWLNEIFNDKTDGEYMVNPIIKKFRLYSDSIGKKVNFGLDAENNPEILNAKVLSINEDGSLTLLANDEEICVNSGEIRYID